MNSGIDFSLRNGHQKPGQNHKKSHRELVHECIQKLDLLCNWQPTRFNYIIRELILAQTFQNCYLQIDQKKLDYDL